MKAIEIHSFGGTEVLQVRDVPVPDKPDEVLVEVAFAGLNFVDIYMREGRYPNASTPRVLGIEASGTVKRADAAGVFKVADRVAFANGAIGAYADYVSVPARALVRVPTTISLLEAASSLEQALTADILVNDVMRPPMSGVHDPQWAVVHAAAGGVGRWLTRMLIGRGVRVVALASTQTKRDQLRALGAHAVVDATDGNWPNLCLKATDSVAPAWVFDSVGVATFDASLELLATRGHLVLYGAASGVVPSVAMTKIMTKSATLSRPMLMHYIATAEVLSERAQRVFALIEHDRSWLDATQVFQLSDVARAHEALASRARQGKVLLSLARG
jgi:NADPH:quinone reductase